MAINQFSVNCDTYPCDTGILPAADPVDQYCISELNQSEINSMVHFSEGNGPTNWGPTIADTDFNIDNTDATGTLQKRFFGVGSIGASEPLEVRTNDFNDNLIQRTFTLTFTIFDIGDDTYDYFRAIQCGSLKPRFDWTTVAQKLYGSSVGIIPSRFDVDFPLEEGEESVEKIVITAVWKAKTSPDRLNSPLP